MGSLSEEKKINKNGGGRTYAHLWVITRQPAALSLTFKYSSSHAHPDRLLVRLCFANLKPTIWMAAIGLEGTFLHVSIGAFETCSCFALCTTILHTLLFFHFSKAAKALLPVDEISNKLNNTVKSQGRSKNSFVKLNEEIGSIKTQISQVSCCKWNVCTIYILEKGPSSQIFLSINLDTPKMWCRCDPYFIMLKGPLLTWHQSYPLPRSAIWMDVAYEITAFNCSVLGWKSSEQDKRWVKWFVSKTIRDGRWNFHTVGKSADEQESSYKRKSRGRSSTQASPECWERKPSCQVLREKRFPPYTIVFFIQKCNSVTSLSSKLLTFCLCHVSLE